MFGKRGQVSWVWVGQQRVLPSECVTVTSSLWFFHVFFCERISTSLADYAPRIDCGPTLSQRVLMRNSFWSSNVHLYTSVFVSIIFKIKFRQIFSFAESFSLVLNIFQYFSTEIIATPGRVVVGAARTFFAGVANLVSELLIVNHVFPSLQRRHVCLQTFVIQPVCSEYANNIN